MTRVLLTGAAGFVGRTLSAALAQAGYAVRAALRSEAQPPAGCVEGAVIGDIGPDTDWQRALQGVDQVIHAAARVHVAGEDRANTELYMRVNALGTQRLAAATAAAGVRRFILLSTVKVNGERTDGRAYTALDEPHPEGAYAMSKWAAERQVAQMAAESAMQAVIVRAPLVYGPGVGANFLRLIRWIDRGWPLPFGAVCNVRSFVSIWNLCDLLVNVTRNPAAPGRTWMVSDGEDLSTPQLTARIALALGRRARLLPVPVKLLRLADAVLNRRQEIARLCDSLVVDASPTRAALGWAAPLSVDEGLARTAAWYLAEGR